MSIAKHTPGPWHVADDGWNTEVYAADGYCIIDAGQGPHLHETYTGNDEHWATKPGAHIERSEDEERANARLIAAAPQLLEALKDACYMLYGNGNASPKLQAAIDKAEGRS